MLAIKYLKPLANCFIVKKVVAETKTKSGIILTSVNYGKQLNQGTIVAVDLGRVLENGQVRAVSVKVGDIVLLPEYGGTKLVLEGNNELYIYRNDDIMGTEFLNGTLPGARRGPHY